MEAREAHGEGSTSPSRPHLYHAAKEHLFLSAERRCRSAAAARGSEATDPAVTCNGGLGSGRRETLPQQDHRWRCPPPCQVEPFGVAPHVAHDHGTTSARHPLLNLREKP